MYNDEKFEEQKKNLREGKQSDVGFCKKQQPLFEVYDVSLQFMFSINSDARILLPSPKSGRLKIVEK